MELNNISKLSRTVMLALLAAFVMAAAVPAQTGDEQFTATLASLQGGGTTPVVIHIDRYSSDAEVQKLAGILNGKGPDALRDALWDLEGGYIRVGGGLGYPVAVARSRQTDTGRVIRLMMDRPISFRESVSNSRSTDYPFGYIEIKLDRNGKGEGQFFAAAKVTMTAGTVDIESYSPQPLRILNVRKR
ncbi:MAG TPA: hypothetical protein VKK31_03235 [Thermoanaerobaculia bacterium]|nr:hypothetical protein [Thermoanaerobaculia bacterium]